MKQPPLTEAERHVLQHKGTEPPFSGRFLFLSSKGTYCCRQCGAPLYHSDSKFDAGCGWPSFDDEEPGAIERRLDADGRRTEVLCQACGGHLGHVFEGEQLTEKNLRHCVNAQSLSFQPKADEGQQVAVFGGGCFWCLEALFQRVIGVSRVTSGYCGGTGEDAHYDRICHGQTDHIEVIQIQFDSAQVAFEQLLELFFDCHDPTSQDQQGADRGKQYRSVVFCQSDEQKRQLENYIHRLTESKVYPRPIVTQIAGEAPFYPAEPEHQNYYRRHGDQPYCAWNITPKLAKLVQKYGDRIGPE
ncbi:bifunctional methionine sulfoxide reductase B/A protein [Ferrimonas gelatinilytica]|uniref:Peptide methionine sulfoxide reductase MsrA n=1 Tax=Ferrimonas gelatinilytica TaxID=1255257 RepID=A0ABP9S0Z7_9GAMM